MVFPLKPTGAGESSKTSSYGIDTIKVGYKIALSADNLDGWKHTTNSVFEKSDDKVYNDIFNTEFIAPNGTVIHLKYLPKNYKGDIFETLFIEFSLPKLVFGCNHQDIDDWRDAFRIANSIIASIPRLPPLPDIQDAVLYRIDLCANLQVGEEDVSDYIRALQRGNHPHRTTNSYGKSGVIFASQEISTCVYDKHQKCGCAEAKGILRYEISMRNRGKIGQWVGDSTPTLKNITKEMGRDLLIKDMRILHLDTHIVCDRGVAETILSKIYKPSRVWALLGYLESRQTKSVEQMKREGCKSHTIRRFDKLLAEAGISSLSIEGKKTLPALTLLLEEVEEQKIYHKVPSDTTGFGHLDDRSVDSYSLEGKSYCKLNRQPHWLLVKQTNIRPRPP